MTEDPLPPTLVPTRVACSTDGCQNAGVPIDVLAAGPVTCGACDHPIRADGYLLSGTYDDPARTFIELVNGEASTTRPYNDQEAAEAEQRAQAATRAANTQALRVHAAGELTELRASVAALRAIAQKTNSAIGPKDTKDVALEAARIGRALIRVTRLVIDAVETTDLD